MGSAKQHEAEEPPQEHLRYVHSELGNHVARDVEQHVDPQRGGQSKEDDNDADLNSRRSDSRVGEGQVCRRQRAAQQPCQGDGTEAEEARPRPTLR